MYDTLISISGTKRTVRNRDVSVPRGLIDCISFLYPCLTNENVSYFLITQPKTKVFIDLEVTRKPVKPVKPP